MPIDRTQAARGAPAPLVARRARIDTYQQPVVYLRSDCAVCRAEGFEAQAQVEVVANGRVVPAILHRVEADWLERDEVALSDAAWSLLGLQDGQSVSVRHATQLESLKFLRAKVYGRKLDYPSMRALIDDVSHGRVSDLHLAAFVTACAGGRLDQPEIVALTRAMVDVGERIAWSVSLATCDFLDNTSTRRSHACVRRYRRSSALIASRQCSSASSAR